MGKLMVVVGGQYGSEGKGAIVAHLTRTEPGPVLVIRVGGPNAGHTVYDDDGNRWPLRQVPAGVVRPDAVLAIGAGSEIDPRVLQDEVDALETAGLDVPRRLVIDGQATILEAGHQASEREQGLVDRIGSTGKGIGAARAARIMRTAKIAQNVLDPYVQPTTHVASVARSFMEQDGCVIVEGTQGYALGLHAGHYPFCTAGDCTAVDVLAQAGLMPWAAGVDEFQVWVVLRTFPIRVAGNSGPLPFETSWAELVIAPEYTTVTKKMRRVARWDGALAQEAIRANGGSRVVHLALTMFDYWHPQYRGRTDIPDFALWPQAREERLAALDAPIELVGTGPRTIVDWRQR